MFFSIVNMKLRDYYSDIEDFCLSENIDIDEFDNTINKYGYIYDRDLNKLIIE